MTLKDKETIQRALGIIEGVSYGVSDAVAGALIDAVQMIEGALEGEEGAWAICLTRTLTM